MTFKKIATKAIQKVKPTLFTAEVYSSDGWNLGDRCEYEVGLKLTRPELIYLIHQHVGYDSLFKHYKEKIVDIHTRLADLARGVAWDDGIYADVEDMIPEELQDLSELLNSLDLDDEDAVKSVCKALSAVSDGKYTFSFEIRSGDYYFADNVSESLDLTASEARGLLYGEHYIPEIFSKFNVKQLTEDFVNEKAAKKGFAKDYDDYCYDGECRPLENYLDSWHFILELIYEEQIDEEGLEPLLAYFDHSFIFNRDIQAWYRNINACAGADN